MLRQTLIHVKKSIETNETREISETCDACKISEISKN